MFLQMAQARREDVRRDTYDFARELVVAASSTEQCSNDQQRPTVANLVQTECKRTILIDRVFGRNEATSRIHAKSLAENPPSC